MYQRMRQALWVPRFLSSIRRRLYLRAIWNLLRDWTERCWFRVRNRVMTARRANDMILVTHEPLGTVVAIVPFNAPMLLYSYKVAPALAAGNAVIVKPPTDNPLTDIMITELLLEAGVPAIPFRSLPEADQKWEDWLVKDPDVDAVSMTGSTQVGIGIAEIMAKRLAPLHAGAGRKRCVYRTSGCGY